MTDPTRRQVCTITGALLIITAIAIARHLHAGWIGAYWLLAAAGVVLMLWPLIPAASDEDER